MTADVIVTRSGVAQKIIVEEDGVIVKRFQRVDRIMDHFREESENVNRRAHGRLAARIPTIVYFRWRDEWRRHHADRWEWETFLAMRLNDSSYKHLRNQKL